jgi:tetratricopeptide (TPR) repeat protein
MAKAESLVHLDRLEEARDALNNALLLNGDCAEAWRFRGQVLERMGNAREAERCYDETLECLREALEQEPDNVALHIERARLLEDLERVDEAIVAYAAAASKDPTAGSLVRLSDLLLRVGRAADALVPAEQALTRHPTDPGGWLAAGRAQVTLGRVADAEASFRKAKDLGATADAALELARTLHSQKRDAEALIGLQGIGPTDAEALLLRAEIQARLGRAEPALADVEMAIRTAKDGKDLAYRQKGRLLMDLGRQTEAVAAFDAALGLRPADPEAWLDAARAWRTLGQADRARKMIDEALRLDPHHAEARRLRDGDGAAAD